MSTPRTISELEQLIEDIEEDLARPWPPASRPGDYSARLLVDSRDRRLLEMAQELLRLRRWLTKNGCDWENRDLEEAGL